MFPSSLRAYALNAPASIFNRLTQIPTLRSPHRLLRPSLLNFRPKSSTAVQQSLVNQTQVSVTLATHLFSNKFPNSNVVFSPLSIHVVLSLVAAGAKGQTLDQILAFLKSNSVDELNNLSSHLMSMILTDGSPMGGLCLCCANGVWVEKTLSLKHSFKQVVDNVYKATCDHVDFQNKAADVVKEVNSWAEKQTNGLIEKILHADAVNKNTWLIFANAIYFKGEWDQKFDSSETKESDFHLLDGSKVQVPFMTSTEKQFVAEYDDFKVLALSYLQGQDTREFTMYIFLPHAKDGLRSLIEKISSSSDFFDSHVPQQKVKTGKFLIPKFKISSGFKACDVLKELGLLLPFSDEHGLTEMVDLSVGQRGYALDIHHKSFMEVNEDGTEAAAVTTFRVGCARMVKPNVDFVADHPFLFVIREDVTGAVLFMGQVVDPSVD
ncbi:hypothetical protein SSX86_000043 [Deinandra increscens subsp. villosa]|uniref:Serpin domain-containing protein n=1 Tax=Deinandra increscens subsp. villosa TaxID=3103831 RepID=A0AAP0DVU7_9ASTR